MTISTHQYQSVPISANQCSNLAAIAPGSVGQSELLYLTLPV